MDKILPLIIKNSEQTTIDVAVMNEKSYKKSIENNILWHVHGETGRVLPYQNHMEFLSLTEMPGWYEAEVKAVSVNDPAAPTLHYKVQSSGADKSENSDQADASILLGLEAVIVRRKKDLPEGSYTTHLFKSGMDKIRKKTGEEAVELILARENDEMTYEASDLIYHMLVLLAAAEIPFKNVLAELAKR